MALQSTTQITNVVRWGRTEDEEVSRTPSKDELFNRWKNRFRLEKHRYEYFCWGSLAAVPSPYPPLQSAKIKQVQCGGKHFLALSGTLIGYFVTPAGLQNS